MKTKLFPLIFVFITATTVAQPNLKKNDRFEKTTVSEVVTEMDFMGQKITNQNKITVYDATTITAVDKSGYTLQTIISRMITEMKMNGTDFKIDTDENDNELAQQYKAEVQKPTTVVVDKSGNIVNVSAGEKNTNALDKLLEDINQVWLTPAQSPTQQKSGAIWTVKKVKPGGYDFTNTYKTISNNGKIITIEVISEGTIETDVEIEEGQEGKLMLNGALQGTIAYSVETGFLHFSDLASKFAGTVAMSNMEFPFVFNGASKTTVTKK